MKKKIAGHIGAFTSMLVGTTFVHEAFNYRSGTFRFFNLELDINPVVLLDVFIYI